MLKKEPFVNPPITQTKVMGTNIGDISDASIAKIVKALQDVMKIRVFTSQGATSDSFNDSASFESIAKAMVKNTPSEAQASSNIKEKVVEVEHKKDVSKIADIINTIKEHE